VVHENHHSRWVTGGERGRQLHEFDPLDIAFPPSNSARLLNHILCGICLTTHPVVLSVPHLSDKLHVNESCSKSNSSKSFKKGMPDFKFILDSVAAKPKHTYWSKFEVDLGE